MKKIEFFPDLPYDFACDLSLLAPARTGLLPLFLTLLMALPVFAQMKFSVTEDSHAVGGRIFLPCTFGACMLDTGGQINLLRLSPETEHFAKIGQRVISSLNGTLTCDVLAPMGLEVAGKNFVEQSFLRCPDGALDPMLGLNFLNSEAFGLFFSSNQLVWLQETIRNPTGALEPAGGWIAFPAELNEQVVHVVFDTGTPISMVDSAFVADHPGLFRPAEMVPESSFVPPNQLFNLVRPIKIGSFLLEAGLVQSVNFKTVFKDVAYVPDIFLGYNSMKAYDWSFDLKAKVFSVNLKQIPQ